MNKVVCEICGSTSIRKQDGYFACTQCGVEYGVEELQSMLEDDEVEELEEQKQEEPKETKPKQYVIGEAKTIIKQKLDSLRPGKFRYKEQGGSKIVFYIVGSSDNPLVTIKCNPFRDVIVTIKKDFNSSEETTINKLSDKDINLLNASLVTLCSNVDRTKKNYSDYGNNESILKKYGYSVGKDSPSIQRRRAILKKLVENGTITKSNVLWHLIMFIRRNKHLENMTDAVTEWQSDLDWAKDNL